MPEPSPMTEPLRNSLGLQDGEQLAEIDELVALAVELCGAQIGLATLLETERQIHLSRVGTTLPEVPIEQSFCRYTVEQNDVMVVQDACADSRFADNALVTGEPHIRFYAGIPLRAPNGEKFGALCVISPNPRTLSPSQCFALAVLGRQIGAQFALRQQNGLLTKAANDLRLSGENLHGFFHSIPTEAYIKDDKGRLVFYNEFTARKGKVSSTEWLGQTVFDRLPEATARQIHMVEQHILRTREPHESYFESPAPDGKSIFYKSFKVPFERPDGSVMLACLAIDMTTELHREGELQKMHDALEASLNKLRTLSLTDELTGLHNRRAFNERLAAELVAATRSHSTLAVIMLDIDNFKKVNDTYGHGYGDEVLENVANILAQIFRVGDVPARYGGEEFAVIMRETNQEQAVKVCHRVEKAMRDLKWRNGPVTASMGIALSRPSESNDSILDRADRALYAAKRQGKARTVLYSEELNTPPAASRFDTRSN